MKSPVDFYAAENEDGSVLVFEKETLAAIGLTTPEQLLETFGESGHWRKVWLKPANGERRREITQACQQPDALLGLRYDATLEPAATAVAFIAQWQGFDPADRAAITEPTIEAYFSEAEVVTEFLQSIISLHRNPNPAAHPGFRQALSDWQQNKQKSSGSASPTAP